MMGHELNTLIARIDELDVALSHVSGLARLLAADRQRLEQVRDDHARQTADDAAKVAAKLDELTRAKEQVDRREVEVAQQKAELKAKSERWDVLFRAIGA
jgi:hypothetical protein